MEALMDIAYLRVSTPQPDEEKIKRDPKRRWQQEESLPKQREMLTEWYAWLRHEGELVLIEDDASGKRDDRAGFNRIVHLVQQNQVRRIYIWDTHRAARKSVVIQRLMWHCWQHGVTVYLKSMEGAVDWNNPQHRMMIQVKGITDEYFLGMKSQMVRDGYRYRKSKGLVCGHPYYGYERVDEKHVIVPERVAAIRLSFSALITGKGGASIARLLETKRQEGVLPGPQYASRWKSQAVLDILRNPIYRGSDLNFPAVIDEDTFKKAQEILDRKKPLCQRAKAKGDSQPFRGLLRCGHHGERMMAWAVKNSRERGRELRCAVEFCPNDDAPLDLIAEKVVGLLQHKVIDDLAALRQQTSLDGPLARQVKEAEATLTSMESQLKMVVEGKRALILRRTDGLLSDEQLEPALGRIDEQISRLSGQRENLRFRSLAALTRAKDREASLEWVKALVERYRMASSEEQATLLQRSIHKITVYERCVVEVEFLEGRAQ